jgi:CBS domain-containing protein
MPIWVKDIMIKPISIDLNKTVKAAGEVMRERRIDALIVTKNKNPIGIITDSDLIKKIIAKNIKPSSVKVKDIFSGPLVTTSPDDNIMEATNKMKKNRIKRLAVVAGGKLIGIISLSDIARASPEMISLLEYKLKMREWPTEIIEKFTSGICDSCSNYSADLQNISGKWICESCREEEE